MTATTFDAIDLRILQELQEDGRMTNHELAERVGLSPSPCLRRVRLLEANGVIARYTGIVDPSAMGLNVTAFVSVRLRGQGGRHLAAFEEAIATFPEVMECYLMNGESDYQLRLLVGTLTEFETFLRQKLTLIEGVSQVTSSFVLRQVVCKTAVPVLSL